MSGLGVHVLLFLAVSVAIVVMSAFYADARDGAALRGVPRRLSVFLVSCGIVAVVMLVCEALFASVD